MNDDIIELQRNGNWKQRARWSGDGFMEIWEEWTVGGVARVGGVESLSPEAISVLRRVLGGALVEPLYTVVGQGPR